jgi:Na+-translocating ferredoxin:NAD+ oxidoreductase RnfG subunit
MKEMANKALRLGIIGAVAALLLAVTNNFTEPVIAERRARELKEALTILSGGRATGEAEAEPAEGVAQRWALTDGSGWILEMEGRGYGGPMTIVASYDTDGSIMVSRFMDNNETVGFGKKAEKPSYMEIFSGTGGTIPVPKVKSDLGSNADVVSGATVTFSGITEALRAGSELVKEWEGR